MVWVINPNTQYLFLKDIPNKIMILRKAWKIIVFPAFDPDQGYLSRIQGLQRDAVFDRDQPVARAVQDINMTSDFLNPDVHP